MKLSQAIQLSFLLASGIKGLPSDPNWDLEARALQFNGCSALEQSFELSPKIQRGSSTNKDAVEFQHQDGTQKAKCPLKGQALDSSMFHTTQKHLSLQHCADLCLCNFDAESCKTFSWTADKARRGLGLCQISSSSLEEQDSDATTPKSDSAEAIVYHRDCFETFKLEKRLAMSDPPHPPHSSSSSSVTTTTTKNEPEITGESKVDFADARVTGRAAVETGKPQKTSYSTAGQPKATAAAKRSYHLADLVNDSLLGF